MGRDALDEHRLRSLIEVGRGLVSELDPEAVLHRVLEVARELTGARYAALGILDRDRQALERFITLGIDEETRQRIGDLPRGRGVLGLLIQDPRPLRLNDVGSHPRSYGFPPGHPPMSNFLGVPIVIGGLAWGNLYLTEKAADFDQADEEAAVILADWAAVAIRNARLYTRVETQRDELQRAVRGLEATTEIARAVGGETDLERILESIVKRGRALVDAGSVMILLAEGQELGVAAAAGDAARMMLNMSRLPLQGSLAAEVMESGKSMRLTGVSYELSQQPRKLSDRGSIALLSPLRFRGETLGVLAAFDPLRDGDFTADDERLLSAFAASAATAVATAQSAAEERLRQSLEAAEHERARWARELHDQSLQELAGLRVLLSSARRSDAPEEADRLLGQAVKRADAAIAEMRRLMADLRPASLDELGVESALAGLVDRVVASSKIEVDLDVDLAFEAGRTPMRLAAQAELVIFRLVQEALNNAATHAGCARAAVEIREVANDVHVQISDNGGGFNPGELTPGFGLRGMRERVNLVGGTLEIRSAPGTGTTIKAVLPAEHREEEGPRQPGADEATEPSLPETRSVSRGSY